MSPVPLRRPETRVALCLSSAALLWIAVTSCASDRVAEVGTAATQPALGGAQDSNAAKPEDATAKNRPDETAVSSADPQAESGPNRPPRVPELPPAELPKQTRARPDPKAVQIEREAVSVQVSELLKLSDGIEAPSDVRVVENYVAEYFRRAGHPVVDPTRAVLRVEGAVSVAFVTHLIVKGEIVAWKLQASSTLRVLDAAGNELERSELTDVSRVNVKSEKSGAWDVRRVVAKEHHDRLFLRGKLLTRADVVPLLDLLVQDPFERDRPTSGNEVVDKLADVGLSSVPYLLEALTDTRVVLAPTTFAGLKRPEDLKVYHLADKALEEVFQKVSRMAVDTPDHQRFTILRGWENEWRRFCPSFRESPQHRPESPAARSADTPPADAASDGVGTKG